MRIIFNFNIRSLIPFCIIIRICFDFYTIFDTNIHLFATQKRYSTRAKTTGTATKTVVLPIHQCHFDSIWINFMCWCAKYTLKTSVCAYVGGFAHEHGCVFSYLLLVVYIGNKETWILNLTEYKLCQTHKKKNWRWRQQHNGDTMGSNGWGNWRKKERSVLYLLNKKKEEKFKWT